MIVKWYGTRVVNSVRDAAMDGLVSAASLLRNNIQDNISIPAPPHSLPGEMPHKLSGDLYNSWKIFAHKKEMAVRVATDIPYAIDLEFGTPQMAPRPFMFRTLVQSAEAIREEVNHVISTHLGKDVDYSINVK